MAQKKEEAGRHKASSRRLVRAPRVSAEHLVRMAGRPDETVEPPVDEEVPRLPIPWLIERLQALGHDGERFLAAVVGAEEAARGKSVLEALEDSMDALFAPTVLLAIHTASWNCREPGFISGETRAVEDTSKSREFLQQVFRALTREDLGPEKIDQDFQKEIALAVAWQIRRRADELAAARSSYRATSGEPTFHAFAAAKKHTFAALRKEGVDMGSEKLMLQRIRDARRSRPDLGWPDGVFRLRGYTTPSAERPRYRRGPRT